MITLENVYKSYKSKSVLTDINLQVQSGELMVLIGSSGCGKTTLLKLLNKLISADKGKVTIDGVSISRIKDTALRRSMGYVVQEGGLFPHMTVAENIGQILKVTGVEKAEREQRVDELLKIVELPPENYRNLYPSQLSGGQQQRVGVARAFSVNPSIILMDEPFSALDPVTRAELQDEICRLQKQFQKTIIFVTHDIDEAIKLATRVCIIQDGRIAQCDTPENILKKPANDYVRQFVGKNRLWENPEFIKARDIMKEKPVCISRDRTVFQAIQIMNQTVVDSILVADHGKLEGIVWLKDIRNFSDYKFPLTDYISTDYVSVYEDTSLKKIVNSIDYNISGIIPVISHENDLLGYLTKSSLLAALSKQYEPDEHTTHERNGTI
ncbi:Choline transport ATP-binding protein OpuBA [bioreactor metagenome]|uniref:Choline transport ATP-binding protein OpuBA n=1 Tax=bioreactor metagenome TaxID=1076179 RepID=A0A644ZW88_9ZZZZ